MMEVNRREKEGGIIPDPYIDTFMKVTYLNLNSFVFFCWVQVNHSFHSIFG